MAGNQRGGKREGAGRKPKPAAEPGTLAAPPPKGPGRPADYTTELAETILDRMSGGETLTAICSEEGMPSDRTVRRWARNIDEFRPRYAHAREEQAHAFFEATVDIADDGKRDYNDGKVDHDHIQRAKLRVDTRKWAASKLLPKVYGDKLDVSVNEPPSDETEEQIVERLRAKAARLGLSFALN